MKNKMANARQAHIWVGSRRGYDGPSLTREDVLEAVASYQREAPEDERGTARLTPTTFVFQDYVEEGWEISLLLYPRFPQSPVGFKMGAHQLAIHLMKTLSQNRVSVLVEGTTTLYENENAEQGPSRG